MAAVSSRAYISKPEQTILNANQATLQQLQNIRGIGPKKAAAIIAYRQQHHGIAQIEELLQIKGIGKKLFNKLKKIIKVA